MRVFKRFALVFASVSFLGLMCGCPQNKPAGSTTSSGGSKSIVRTDLTALQQQLSIPQGASSARWLFCRSEDVSYVPSPGSAAIIGRVQLSAEAIKHLRGVGIWNSEPLLPAGLESVQHPDTAPKQLLRSHSAEPGKSVLRGSTWMKIVLWVDPDNHILFFMAEKS